MNNIEEKLIEKSIEAFSIAIEVYNKPTIKYRVEGFAMFMCNAWELMLKAHLIKTSGNNSIYYKDNPNRTITLENCVQKIFTNNKDPLRINLEKIIELRNTSTHFITEEYEMIYVPLFQSCVLNFNEKMMAFHDLDMTEHIPQNFLTLSISMKSLDESVIIAKYPEEIANKIVSINEALSNTINENNDKFAIKIEHHHFITKNKNIATSFVGIDNSSDTKIKVVKELKDPNTTHKYTSTSCVKEISTRISRTGLICQFGNTDNKFTSYHFNLFCEYYGLKSNERYCYVYTQYANKIYSYSIQTIDFIVDELKKDPENIIQNLKKALKK